ncbi:MAG: redox-sensing transcriptional repressor Rex [Ignavibacteria bacterium]|nr:redox-sensing transcriptional repressor Rex [Ignavibacteria bacterium]
MRKISQKTIERIIIYRKLLKCFQEAGETQTYSYKIANMLNTKPSQVRRDLMEIGYSGSPAHGYNIEELIKAITKLIDSPNAEPVVIVGVGNLGRAIMDYSNSIDSNLKIIAGFDNNERKVNKVFHGIRVFHIDNLKKILNDNKVKIAIITTNRESAQSVALDLINFGVNGILNFTPAKLNLPSSIIVENIDMLVSLEKVAFFSRNI